MKIVVVAGLICSAQALPPTLTYASAQTATSIQSEIQPLHTIAQAVEDFIVQQSQGADELSVSVKPIDSRLRLTRCEKSLQSDWSNGSRVLGRVMIQVSCLAPRPWRVNVQATITKQALVWILNRGVRRDERLDQSLLVQQAMTIGGNSSSFRSLGTPVTDIEPWLGFTFAQRVNAGKVLSEQMLKPAQLISKGDAVVIQHTASGLSISTRGVALHDAGKAEQTQVRNTSSGKLVDVVVVAPGTVETLR